MTSFRLFIDLLKEQRTILEYEMANLRITDNRDISYNTGYVNYGTGYNKSRNRSPKFKYCVLHNSCTHTTSECTTYLNKVCPGKVQLDKGGSRLLGHVYKLDIE